MPNPNTLDDTLPLDPEFDPFHADSDGVDADVEEFRRTTSDAQAALLEGAPLPSRPATHVSDEEYKRAKMAYATHGGNVAAVARDTGLSPTVVNRLAADGDWPLQGDGDSQTEKSQKTRLRRIHLKLEQQMEELLESLGVEEKQIHDVIDKGTGSVYVATLSQRSGAFKQVFDSYVKVGEMIAPEVYGRGPSDPNGVVQRQGGIAGADRDLADLMGRVMVGMADEVRRQTRAEQALTSAQQVDAEYTVEAEDE